MLIVTEALVLPLTVLMVIATLAALIAWFRQRHASAHTLNLIPTAVISALSLFAVATHTAGHVTDGALVLLASLIGLAVLCVLAAVRSVRWRALFWLTVLVNLAMIGGLIYMRFFFRIF